VTRSLLSAATVMFLASAATPAVASSDYVTHVPCDPSKLITAINNANARGGTLILAHNCIYHLTSANTDADGLPKIINRITIKGRNATIMRDSNANKYRIFEVEGPKGDLKAKDLTVKGGELAGDNGAGILVQPGGTLHLADSTVTNNNTGNSGGAISNAGRVTLVHTVVTGNKASNGGGIYSLGSLSITKGSRLISNSASDRGGALFTDGGTAEIDHSTLNGNSANDGGAFYGNNGTTELTDSAVTHNTATTVGGGLDNFNPPMIVRRTLIKNNTAANGGGIRTDAWMALIGSEVTGNQANGTNGVGGGIENQYLMEIRGSRITGNQATSQGGGVYTLFTTNVSHTTVSGNTITGSTGQGGGFWNDETLVLDDVKVKGNRTTGSASQGGGIYNKSFGSPNRGNLLLTKTEVTHNTAGTAGGVWTDTQFRVFKDSTIRHNHPTNCAGSGITPVYHCTN
jgi:predicted outer membrane repeat protein